MSEQVREVTLPPRFWSLSVWCLGIIVGLLGIGGSFDTYLLGVIVWSVGFYYLLINMHRQYRGSFGLIAAILTLLTEIAWTCSIILSLWYGLDHILFELDSVYFRVLDINPILLGIGAITMGIAIVLSGVIYAQNLSGTSRILLPLVVISLIVVGFFGVIVGISIFSPLGVFTIYDIPLISIAMIIPCIFGVLYHLDRMIDHVIDEYGPNSLSPKP